MNLFPYRTPLSTAGHTSTKHPGCKSWTDINTGLQFISRTLACGLSSSLVGATLAPALCSTLRLSLSSVLASVLSSCLGFILSSILVSVLSSSLSFIPSYKIQILSSIPISSTIPVLIAPTPVSSSSLFLPSITRNVIIPPACCLGPASIPPSNLCSSVPWPSIWSWTGVAPILSLPWVPLTSRVWLPGTIRGTAGPDGRAYGTLKLTECPWPVQGAVARNARTYASHLLLYTRVMLYAAGDVCPGTGFMDRTLGKILILSYNIL